MPSTPNRIEVANAAWNATSWTCALAPATAAPLAVACARTVVRTATPTDAATCRLVLNSDDARPVSSDLIVENVAVCDATNAKLIATPRRNMSPRIHHRLVSRLISRKRAEVTHRPVRPIANIRRGPRWG